MEIKKEEVCSGQQAIRLPVALWITGLVLCWALNSVVVKFVVADMPSAWGAFLRFAIAYPFILVFIIFQGVNLKIGKKEFLLCTVLSGMTFVQIMLFNIGSQYKTGGRVTMLIFTYPLIVPFIAHILLRDEKLQKNVLIGSVVAFFGLMIPLYDTLANNSPTLKGDIIEFLSSLVLSLLIVTNKYAFSFMDKWTVFFWQSTINLLFFGIAALLTPGFVPAEVSWKGWWSLGFQAIVISGFAFMSYQYILSRHNSSKVSIFFFATPLFGMLLSGLLQNEPFEWTIFAGCIAVGAGIFIANSSIKSINKE